jgi:two-component system, NarL family, invasion response regulator UvrY
MLSDREYRVLCLLGAGKTLTQIAKALFVSPKTVSTYRVRILEKLKMTTTGELVRYAVENHLH